MTSFGGQGRGFEFPPVDMSGHSIDGSLLFACVVDRKFFDVW